MVTSSPAVKKRGVTRRTIRFLRTMTLFMAAPTLVSRVAPRAVNRFVDHAQAEFGGHGLVGGIMRGDGVDTGIARFEFCLRGGYLHLQLLLHGRNGKALRSLVQLAVQQEGRAQIKVRSVFG